MRFDAPTLMAMTAFVALIVGGLFLISWRHARGRTALLFWAFAHLVGGTGSVLSGLRVLLPFDVAVGLGNALILAGYGLIWAGARSFERRPVCPPAVLAACLVWLAAWCAPAFQASIEARIVLASSGAGLYCLLGAAEFWRGRSEFLPSRWPAVVLLASYALVYLLRIPPAVTGPALAPGQDPLASLGVVIMCFAAVLYTVALAFVFIALTKERAEGEQRLAAETDSLTGAATRRAFVAEAERRLAEASPAAVVLFDLDHFKGVNDTYGHAVGDAVLAGFADAARALMPADAVLARLGGEEFACFAQGIDRETALRFGERVRASVAGTRVAGLPNLRQTVSVGIATTEGGRDFDAMLRRADGALYRAKNAGRDRVVCAGLDRAA